jgi:hypothetical protein
MRLPIFIVMLSVIQNLQYSGIRMEIFCHLTILEFNKNLQEHYRSLVIPTNSYNVVVLKLKIFSIEGRKFKQKFLEIFKTSGHYVMPDDCSHILDIYLQKCKTSSNLCKLIMQKPEIKINL